MSHGPYLMDGMGFYLKNWEPNFNFINNEINNATMWITLYNLQMEY